MFPVFKKSGFLSLESQWGAADFNEERRPFPILRLRRFPGLFIKAAFIFLNLLKVKGKCVIIVVRIKLRTAERGKESVACRLRRKSVIFFRGGSQSFKSARVFLF